MIQSDNISGAHRTDCLYAFRVRDLNDIVTRNAAEFLQEAQKWAAAKGRVVTIHTIAGRMAKAMGGQQDTVRKHLGRCLAGTGAWRADDIQAFGAALGKSPEEMVSLDGSKVSEATVAQQLYAGLNHRISPREAKAVLRRLHRQLDDRPMFSLVQRLTDRLLDASARDEAYEAAHDLIRKSDAWGPKRRELRGRRASR